MVLTGVGYSAMVANLILTWRIYATRSMVYWPLLTVPLTYFAFRQRYAALTQPLSEAREETLRYVQHRRRVLFGEEAQRGARRVQPPPRHRRLLTPPLIAVFNPIIVVLHRIAVHRQPRTFQPYA